MYRYALIHNTSCDSQDLSLIFMSLFICLVLILFCWLVESSSAEPPRGEASAMETSESRACFDSGAITESGICITLLSVKLSQ